MSRLERKMAKTNRSTSRLDEYLGNVKVPRKRPRMAIGVARPHFVDKQRVSHQLQFEEETNYDPHEGAVDA